MKPIHYVLIAGGAILVWKLAQAAKPGPEVPSPPRGAGILGPVDDFLNWAFPGMLKKGKVIPTFGDQPVSTPPFAE